MTSTLAGPVDLSDPDTFTAAVPHEALAELRRTDPVHWQPMDDEPGFWAVLRHADVVTVARRPEIFSSHDGGITVENVDEPTDPYTLPARTIDRKRDTWIREWTGTVLR